MISFDIHTIVSILITVFLALIIINHFFKDLFKLIPFYRNNILLEGFEVAVADPSGNATPPAVTDPSGAAPAPASAPASAPAAASEAEIPDTEKSTIMVDLFEKVNNHMDTIRTIKLSDNFVPINIDKTASEPFVILMNLKLLINNGIYKNELDLKEMYDKYIGNKAIQVLTSDINSVNMNSNSNLNIGSLESSFLTRCKNIVAGHQTIIDQILENKGKE